MLYLYYLIELAITTFQLRKLQLGGAEKFEQGCTGKKGQGQVSAWGWLCLSLSS